MNTLRWLLCCLVVGLVACQSGEERGELNEKNETTSKTNDPAQTTHSRPVVCPKSELEALQAEIQNLPVEKQPAVIAQGLLKRCDVSSMPELLQSKLTLISQGRAPFSRPKHAWDRDGYWMGVLPREICTGQKTDPADVERIKAIYKERKLLGFYGLVPNAMRHCFLRYGPELQELVSREERLNRVWTHEELVLFTLVYHWMEFGGADPTLSRDLIRRAALAGEGPLISYRPSSHLPYTTHPAGVRLPDAVHVAVSEKTIGVLENEVLRLKDRRVPPRFKKGGATSLIVIPLLRNLQDRVDEQKEFARRTKRPFKGELIFQVDHDTPYRTFYDAHQTSLTAEFKPIALAGVRSSRLAQSGLVSNAEHYPRLRSLIPFHAKQPRMGAARYPRAYVRQLGLRITAQGFILTDHEKPLEARLGCTGGETLCLDPAAQADAKSPLDRYDWFALYTTLAELKAKDPSWHAEAPVQISAADDVSMGVVVRTLDVVRHHRDQVATREAFLDSKPQADKPLFSKVTLYHGLPKVEDNARERSLRKHQGKSVALKMLGATDPGDGSVAHVFAADPQNPGLKNGMLKEPDPGGTTLDGAQPDPRVKRKKVKLKVKESELHAPNMSSAEKKSLQAVFSKKKRQIEGCYKRVVQKHGAQKGKLTVKVKLGDDGKVMQVRTVTDDIGKGLAKCVEQKIQRWRFPGAGKPVTVAKRWVFE